MICFLLLQQPWPVEPLAFGSKRGEFCRQSGGGGQRVFKDGSQEMTKWCEKMARGMGQGPRGGTCFKSGRSGGKLFCIEASDRARCALLDESVQP